MKFEAIGATHTGVVREVNQDVILLLKDFGVFLVADGMGGELAGDEAAAQVRETVKRATRQYFSGIPHDAEELNQVLCAALEKSGRAISRIVEGAPHKSGMGSTGSLLCLHRGVYCIAQVGDSRVYLCRNKKVEQLTRDHSEVWRLYEQGMITRDEMETHPQRHLLTQCIGGGMDVRPDSFQGRVHPGDTFLICSDGLTGYMPEGEIFKLLSNEKLRLQAKADHLIRSALDGGGGDNVSVVLVKVESLGDKDNWQPAQALNETYSDTQDSNLTLDQEPPSGPVLRQIPWKPLLFIGMGLLLAGLLWWLITHLGPPSS